MIKQILKTLFIALFKNRGVKRTVNGKEYTFSPYVARGIPKQTKIPMLNDFLLASKDKKVVLDIGAHIGTWAILVAHELCQGGEVYAFEPTPFSFKVLNN